MERTRVNLSMTKDMLERMDKLAEEMGLNRSAYVAMVLKQHMDGQEMLKLGREGQINQQMITEVMEKLSKIAETNKS